jgi:hypothetical protein
MTAQAATFPESGSGFWADEAQIAEALLGRGLPEKAEWHLRQAGESYSNDEVAERHLSEARLLAPDHVAVLIGLYRYYFYKGRLRHALSVAIQCIDRALMELDLVNDWRLVQPEDASFDDYGAILPRFFLFTLKGYAYLNMRLGDVAEGRVAVEKLMELDPNDKLNGSILQDVLDRMGLDDDD